jgi:predicted ATPase
LSDRAVDAPVLLVLEDLHWADTSTLDLVVFLAHNIDDRRILLLATYRTDEMSSAVRIRRLAQGVRRSGAAMALELGPLEHGELTQLLLTRAATPLAVVVTDAIVASSEGNPFFAEELVISAKTASVLVSHILRKLDAPNRLEAAAITRRLRIPSNTAHPAAKHGAKPG